MFINYENIKEHVPFLSTIRPSTKASVDGGDTKKYMAKAKDKSDSFRLMGFGHRVYKNFDPRAVIIKSAAERVAAHVSGGDTLLKLAMELEKIALEQDYFISRKLYPNVDFYSGLIYRGIGFDVSEYTPLFAVGRMPGWISQSAEQASDKEQRIVRPQQIYTGHTRRELPQAH